MDSPQSSMAGTKTHDLAITQDNPQKATMQTLPPEQAQHRVFGFADQRQRETRPKEKASVDKGMIVLTATPRASCVVCWILLHRDRLGAGMPMSKLRTDGLFLLFTPEVKICSTGRPEQPSNSAKTANVPHKRSTARLFRPPPTVRVAYSRCVRKE